MGLVAGFQEAEPDQEHVLRLNHHVLGLGMLQGAQEEPAPHQEDEGEAHLSHHQRAAGRESSEPGDFLRFFLHGPGEVYPGGLPHGKEAHQEGGDQARHQGEPQDPHVQPGCQNQRDPEDAVEGGQIGAGRTGHQEPGGPASQGEEEALRQEVPGNPSGSGSQGEAHSHLPAPLRGPGQHEVGHIAAGQKQDEPHHTPQKDQEAVDGLLTLGPNAGILGLIENRAERVLPSLSRFRQSPGPNTGHVHGHLGPLQGDPGSETSYEVEGVDTPVAQEVEGGHGGHSLPKGGNGNPDLRRPPSIQGQPLEPPGGHAHDGEGMASDGYRPPDDSGVLPETAHPIAVAEDSHGTLLVGLDSSRPGNGPKGAAEGRLQAQELEVTGTHQLAGHGFRHVVGT